MPLQMPLSPQQHIPCLPPPTHPPTHPLHTGVFPRPDNISRTYGGGRNIRPGQQLESEEQQAARQARVGAALARYRQQQGLVVEPAVEAAAQASYERGEVLFKEGKLEQALECFKEAAGVMNVKTRLGAQVCVG